MSQVNKLKNIKIEDFSYSLPDERIAKYPLESREQSKLLRYSQGEIIQDKFSNVVNILQQGQMLIFNDTKVIHARIYFKKESGANIEIFCLEPSFPKDYVQNFASYNSCEWICLVGNLKKWKEGHIVSYFTYQGDDYELRATKQSQNEGEVVVRFEWNVNISFSEVLEICGRLPIPPYLNRATEESDELRYQTIFSKEEGSVAAPTAGLHFTPEIIDTLTEKGVRMHGLTLHVGAGTFRPVKSQIIGEHDMHTEHIIIERRLVEALSLQTKPITAVGTTSVRTLESLYWMGIKYLEGHKDFNNLKQWEAYELPSTYSLKQSMNALLGWFDTTQNTSLQAQTTIMIVPSYKFRVINSMFTNFHQPQSTLLLLVGAAVGDNWKNIYEFAMNNDFRFLSYGDSSLLQIIHY